MNRPSAPGAVKVAIVDDHQLFAESLDLALSMQGYQIGRISTVDGVASQAALLSAIRRLRPTVLLLDLDLGRLGDGARLIRPLASEGIQVVVVTASVDRARWGQCLHEGARTVLSKARPLDEILAAVRRINVKLPVIDADERQELLHAYRRDRLHHAESRERLELLTIREREVLGRLMEGLTVRDIARHAVVSEATVRTQVKSILAKLNVSSQLSAVGLANKLGWQPPPSVRSGPRSA